MTQYEEILGATNRGRVRLFRDKLERDDSAWLGSRNESSWLAKRKKLVMASEMPVLWGLSSYASPYSLFMKKAHGVEDPDEQARMSEAWYWGHKMEDLIAERYTAAMKEAGKTRVICDPGDYTIIQYGVLGATIDRLQYDPDLGWGVLELKNRNSWNAGTWDEKTPDDVLVQMQHQMLCAGVSWGSVACLIGGSRFLWEDVKADSEVGVKVYEKGRWFQDCVSNDTPPPVDETEPTQRILRLLHPDDNGETLHLDAGMDAWDLQYAGACEEAKAAESKKREAQNHIIAALGDATFGVGSHYKYSYKTQERKIGLKVDASHEVALIKARIPYEITGGTKSRVLRRSAVEAGE
jgi:putative phage-type endonuclease